MSRIDDLNAVLAELRGSSGDVEACAVVAEDGLMMASALPQGVEDARVAAMSAAMLTMSARTMTELKRGKLKQLFLGGEDGIVVIMQAGPHAVLIALARKETKLGLLFFEMARAAESAHRVLG
jgi:predicted regulator of Ras-like GTPase activity (Roadblock/LC7/MglB family)